MTSNLPLPPALQSWTPAAPLRLASGEMLAEATVGYQTWGELNAAGDNVIWVCHALTASSDVASWWAGAFGPGRTLDPTRYYIVCANVLGSCYGSAGPSSLEPQGGQRYGAAFPELSVTDLVEHQRLLADHLGIRRIQLVVGASMGGFQVLEWARQEPVRVRRIALIATSWRQPPQALAQARLQCEFIRRDPKFKGGDYPPDDPPAEGLALARQLGHLTYRSAGELDQRFGRERREDGYFQVLSYLDHQGQKLVRRFDALSYLRLTEAMNRFDFAAGTTAEAALARIQQPALVVALDSDQLYYPSEQERLARALPQGRLLGFATAYGHDGFLVDAERLDPALAAFRDEPVVESVLASWPKVARSKRADDQGEIALALIGATGRVGADLLQLLASTQVDLPLRLVAVANSRAAVWQSEGLPPGLAGERLRAQHGGHADTIIDQLLDGSRPAVLVDCTASAQIAARTGELLEAGVAVVTPNKIAFSGSQADYTRLSVAARTTSAGWSATVGAGLPILSTIRRLRAAGDSLLSIDAGLSGTLGHVLTRTQDGASLHQALTEAVQQGLAEPDPRADLSGADVRRKLAIVLREAGMAIEPEHIRLSHLLTLAEQIPWQQALVEHEDTWAAQMQAAARAGERWVYRARWSPAEGASVALVRLPQSDPLASARGTENRVVLNSEFQAPTPIVISGSGAGVRVTAAAVLADLQDCCQRLIGRRSDLQAPVLQTRSRRFA
ncbi:MAG: homoserine O-acetyltransferase [Rhodanobacteraceae bacterium]|nr:homoserine O-acetyltransferase [Rhodanobacteraceae bacterium]